MYRIIHIESKSCYFMTMMYCRLFKYMAMII